MPFDLIALLIHALDSRDVRGGRHILQNRIQQLLHALVAVCGSAAHRHGRTFASSPAQNLFHLFNRRLLALQIHHGQIVVELTDLLHHLRTVQLCIFLHVPQILGDSNIVSLVVVVDISLHLEQVDDTFELVFFSDGQLQHDGVLAKPRSDLLYRAVKVRSQNVHLVDESHTGHVVGVCLTPDVFRLGLNASLCAEDAYSAIQHAKRTLHLHGEIHVAGSVDNIDTMLRRIGHGLRLFFQCPMAGRSS